MEVDKWTDEEDKELIDSYVNERLSISDIAEVHSRTQADIAIRLVKLGIVFNRNEYGPNDNPPSTISNKSCKKCLELTQENESLKLQLSEAMKLCENMSKFKHLKYKFDNTLDKQLFEALRIWRSNTARASNVPAYFILHDTVLIDIVKIKPSNLDELKQMSGIGDVKLARYGEDILTILHNHTVT